MKSVGPEQLAHGILLARATGLVLAVLIRIQVIGALSDVFLAQLVSVIAHVLVAVRAFQDIGNDVGTTTELTTKLEHVRLQNEVRPDFVMELRDVCRTLNVIIYT